jgi:hypothetical protein
MTPALALTVRNDEPSDLPHRLYRHLMDRNLTTCHGIAGRWGWDDDRFIFRPEPRWDDPSDGQDILCHAYAVHSGPNVAWDGDPSFVFDYTGRWEELLVLALGSGLRIYPDVYR